MHILIAPDSFKETLSAVEAAEAIARGVQRALPDAAIDRCPMADGGEGTVDALVNATGGKFRTTQVTGPLGEPVQAKWGVLGVRPPSHGEGRGEGARTAVIEMAEAAGLHLVPVAKRDPTRTTTFGVGQLIAAALDEGCTHIILGIGGSATTDGGLGMAQALGAACGFAPPLRGADLQRITQIDTTTLHPRIANTHITVACDVTNPLTGPNGAAHIYGPQKGATPQQVQQLDAGLAHLANLMNIDPDQPGFGAAGGLGFGLVAFCGATLERGIELVLDAVDFDRRAAQANLVITGEGNLDGQSIQGKTCIGVAQRAAKAGTPTIALVGKADEDAAACLAHGLRAYHAIVNEQVTIEQAMANAAQFLEDIVAQVITQHVSSTE